MIKIKNNGSTFLSDYVFSLKIDLIFFITKEVPEVFTILSLQFLKKFNFIKRKVVVEFAADGELAV